MLKVQSRILNFSAGFLKPLSVTTKQKEFHTVCARKFSNPRFIKKFERIQVLIGISVALKSTFSGYKYSKGDCRVEITLHLAKSVTNENA